MHRKKERCFSARQEDQPRDAVGCLRAWRVFLGAMSWIAWRLAAAISYSQPGSRSGITHLPAAAAYLAAILVPKLGAQGCSM